MMENNFKKDGFTLENCAVRVVLDRIGDKWSILILLQLGRTEKLRFNELNREIVDISQKMLTATLRTLEADGLVSRKIYPEVPPRVEYQITELGKTLLPHIQGLLTWAEQNISIIKISRKRFVK